MVLNVLVFNIWFPKEEKGKKWKGGERSTSPLSPWDVTSGSGGGACNSKGKCKNNSCPPLCLHFVIRAGLQYLEVNQMHMYIEICQQSEHRTSVFGSRVVLCHLVPANCISCSTNACTAACHVPGVKGT